jgi:hypothetical protein
MNRGKERLTISDKKASMHVYRTLRPDDVAEAIDENTIGVVAILGSTYIYTAEFDDVKGIDAVVGAHNMLHPFIEYMYDFMRSCFQMLHQIPLMPQMHMLGPQGGGLLCTEMCRLACFHLPGRVERAGGRIRTWKGVQVDGRAVYVRV